MKTIFVKVFGGALIFALVSLYGSCKKEDEPKITVCNTFEYNDEKYPPYKDYQICKPGYSSMELNFKVGNEPYSFDILCINGCISTVKVIK